MGTGQCLAEASKLLIQLILKSALLIGLHRFIPRCQDHEEMHLLLAYSTIQ